MPQTKKQATFKIFILLNILNNFAAQSELREGREECGGGKDPDTVQGRGHRGKERQAVTLGAGWVGAGEDPSVGVPP